MTLDKNWCAFVSESIPNLSEFMRGIDVLGARTVIFQFIIIINGSGIDVNMIAVAMVAICIIRSCDWR